MVPLLSPGTWLLLVGVTIRGGISNGLRRQPRRAAVPLGQYVHESARMAESRALLLIGTERFNQRKEPRRHPEMGRN